MPDFILSRHAHSEIKNYGERFWLLQEFLCEHGIKKMVCYSLDWVSAKGEERSGDEKIYIFSVENLDRNETLFADIHADHGRPANKVLINQWLISA